MTAAHMLRDEAMRQIRPEDHIGLACMIAMKFTSHRPIEDSEQFGDAMIGLMRAVQTFDPDRGFQFSTYAYHVIKRQIWTSHRSRRKHATSIEKAFLEDLPDLTDPNDDQRLIDTADMISKMMDCVCILPAREQAVIRARLEGKKLWEVGKLLGVTKERVRQIEQRATGLLRCSMAQAGAFE